MSNAPIVLHPLAADEAEKARAWYSKRNHRVSGEFLAELDAAMMSIAETPKRWPRIKGDFRRFLMHRFPFSVVYIERAGLIEVIAVAHNRRKPGYWANR